MFDAIFNPTELRLVVRIKGMKFYTARSAVVVGYRSFTK